MDVSDQRIPQQFLAGLPEGVKCISREGNDYVVIEKLLCPNNHSLMDEDVRIHGEPSIKIRIALGESDGLVYIDPFWGGHTKLFSFLPSSASPGSLSEASCPTCGVNLDIDEPCNEEDCSSGKGFCFYLPGGHNRIHVCARLGCPGHVMEISELAEDVRDDLSRINFPEDNEDPLGSP